MPTEAIDVGVSDQELFNEANMDEVPAEEVVAEVPEAIVEQEQPRDEAGRFAALSQIEQLAEVAAEKPPAPPPVDDNAAMIPSFRLKQEADARRQLETDLANERAERAALRQRLEALERPTPKAEPVKVEKPDPLLDPEGYEKYLETKFEEKLLNNHRESSLAQAHRTYKTEFEEAYAAAQKVVDPALRARMQNSRDPGETLIEWHREQKVRAEVGNDPNAFFEKRFEAYLADPANQAKVLERIRGAAQQQPGATRQASATSLPPSLTRATTATTVTADDDDISDEGLWRSANA
jgi:hypothetical protein